MNKTIKGCLIVVIIFILGGIGSIFLIINSVDKAFILDKNKVDKSWNNYVDLVSYRNRTILNNKNMKNILPLINITEENLKKSSSKKDLLENEYIINDSLRNYKYMDSVDQKLNNSLLIYNTNVKEFNSKYTSFPYSYLRIKKSVSLYDYFEIVYGKNNDETIKKNQKINDWIENGGELKTE